MAARRRSALVVAVAGLTIAALVGSARAQTEAPPLLPDLFILPAEPYGLTLTVEGGRTLLRHTTQVANRGTGPLEVFPSPASNDCDGDRDAANDRDASQRIFADTNASGGFEPEADGVLLERVFGCMRYHAAHRHWHVLDFARYQLRREPGGRLVASARKIGFCLADHSLAYPGPFAPTVTRYPFGAAGARGCDSTATQGVSVGWADNYPLVLPGQQLDVTGLRRGRYCLRARVDPLDLLTEGDGFANERGVRLALRPRKLTVRKLTGGCRI